MFMTTYNTSTILSHFTLMLEGPNSTTPARSLGILNDKIIFNLQG